MNEFEEFESLKQQLINHYQQEMALSKHAHTLPVNQKEVEIVKKLIMLAGGREAQDIMIECWNIARMDYPAMYVATRSDFPFCRMGWNRRGVAVSPA